MAEIVKVKFIHSHGSYNPGEVAGLSKALAEKLCSGKRPCAILASEAGTASGGGLDAQMEALSPELREALKERFLEEVAAARRPLLAELEKARAEAAPLLERVAEAQAEIEKLRARVLEGEAALAKASKPAVVEKPVKK